MRRPTTWSLLPLLAACEARISGAPTSSGLVDAATSDDAAAVVVMADAASIDAVTLGPWSAPAKIPGASSTTVSEDDVTLSSNTLEMIFAIDGTNGKDLYYASRTSPSGAWTTPVLLPFNSPTDSDETPRFSSDDKTLYFASDRAGTLDIYTVTRDARGSTTWGTPQELKSVNTTTLTEKWFMPCPPPNDSTYVMVQSTATNGTDLVEGTIGGGPPVPIAKLNSAQSETGTFLSQDCRTIFFASARTSPTMIFASHRDSVTAPWQSPTPVIDFPILGGNGNQEDPWMSADGRTFVFASNAAGTKDIYISTR
jgi:Tol biopolymer transport system component